MDEIIDNDLSDSSEDDDDEDHEDEVEHDEGDEDDDDDTSSGYDADVNVDSAEEEDSDSMVELGYESDGVRTDTDFIYDGLEEEYSDEEDANNVHVLHPLL